MKENMMKRKSIFVLVLVLTLFNWSTTQAETGGSVDNFDCTTVTQIPQAQCEALVAFDAVNSNSNLPSDWFNNLAPCSWSGVTCDSGMRTIIRLVITSDNLSAIPTEIRNLGDLVTLDLSDNSLTSLPREIGDLNDLRDWFANDNQLTSLPREIGNLSNLKALSLNNNQLTALPSEIGNLSLIKRLYVTDNQLTSLPREIGNLSTLFHLNVNNNQLTALPPEIGDFSTLGLLYVAGNQLTALPPEIANLGNLMELDISRNQLTDLPLAITNLTVTGELNIEDNPLCITLIYIATWLDSYDLPYDDSCLPQQTAVEMQGGAAAATIPLATMLWITLTSGLLLLVTLPILRRR